MVKDQDDKSIITQTKDSLTWLLKNRSEKKFPILIFKIAFFYIVVRIVYFLYKNKINNNDKIVVSCTNLYYSGNSKAVFEYMKKYPEKFEIYWIAKNRKTLSELKKTNIKVIYAYSISGIPYFLKTDVWVRSHTGFGEMILLPHKNYKVIQLTHGSGPKGVNYTRKNFRNYDALCLSTDYSKNRWIKLYDAPKKIIYLTGYPRMDTLYSYLKKSKTQIIEKMGLQSYDKIVLYALTFEVGLYPWNNEYEEFEKFCKYCKDRNIAIILRIHPYAKSGSKLNRILKKYDNLYELSMSEEPDTMKLLAITDILITDWSSIYVDYYLSKRPILFVEHNKEYFTKKRGKPPIPPNFRAGERATNSEEFYNAMDNILKKGNQYITEQKKQLKLLHGNVDGKSSERVVKLIEEIA